MFPIDELRTVVDETRFSGVITVSRSGRRLAALSSGFADRANERPNQIDTQFAIASATKGLTALTVAGVIESGQLALDTTLRSLIPVGLDLVDPDVTIEHLLGHTSGVGDYIDEDVLDDIDAHLFELSPHMLQSPTDYLPLLVGRPQQSPPGERFKYNNSGFAMLAIAAEAATGRSFYDLMHDLVLEPAGMTDTAFLRSDDLPSGAALGYVESGRSNVFHLPVRGTGDGGLYSTAADLERLWASLFEGRIVSKATVDQLTTIRNPTPNGGIGYGLGFWVWPSGHTVEIHGCDAGVSCQTVHDRPSGVTYAVLANDSSGAWPIATYLDHHIECGTFT